MIHLPFLMTCASLAASAAIQDASRLDADLASFDKVWEVVDQRHFDPEHNGIDWNAARLEFRPRAQVAEDREATREVISEMLALLGQSHFRLIAQEVLGDGEESDQTSPAGTVGFDVRVRGDVVWVTRVEPGSPAEAAGIRTGWALTGIEGETMADLLARVPRDAALRPDTNRRGGLLPSIDGKVGTSARFTFETVEGDVQESIELTRVERGAVPYDIRGLPRYYLTLRTERREHGGRTIGVLHFSNWFAGIERDIRAALDAMAGCDGVVLDLRGNTGGDGMMACRVAGHFFDQPATLGTQVSHRLDWEYKISPRGVALLGPLVILTDETTGSASEIFTGGMQALGRARVIGEASAGAALPSTLTSLPNGDFFLHAVGDFLTAEGESLEGGGVQPDQLVPLLRADLLAGRDAYLDSAARWIVTELDG